MVSSNKPSSTSPAKPPPLSKARGELQHSQQTTAHNVEKQPAEKRRRGMEHHPAQRKSASGLAFGLLAVAACNAVPAVYDVVLHFQAIEASQIPVWVYLVFLMSLLQCVFAVYLFQLPDWSSVWMAALTMLAQAAFFAMLAAIFFLTKDGAAHQWLELGAEYAGKAPLWCFLMVCVDGLLAYFAGRTSVRWRKAGLQLQR